jgi:hypothetical protein
MIILIIRLELGDGISFTFYMCIDEVTGPFGLATEPIITGLVGRRAGVNFLLFTPGLTPALIVPPGWSERALVVYIFIIIIPRDFMC